MEDPLIHLIYASRASAEFREHGVPDILEKSRLYNAQLGVTGMLLYVEGSFFQILEGPQQAVVALFEKIRPDQRHGLVTEIIKEPIARRDFETWTMGYAAMGLAEVGRLTGENDFFADASCMTSLNRGRARKLLHAFRGGSWRVGQTGKMRAVDS